ncbi:hypothetical protein SRHO_G00274280 [Serrasalmus rhombeus]
MTFGGSVDADLSSKMVQVFLERGHHELDTAFIYTGGQSETIIGGMQLPKTVKIATKANPLEGNSLNPESLRFQLETSLKRLRTQSVDIFYLHFSDHQTPIQDTLQACNELYKEESSRNWAYPTMFPGKWLKSTPSANITTGCFPQSIR